MREQEVMCDGNNECFRLDAELARVSAQRDALLEALESLMNEARGLLAFNEPVIRESAGNTNVNCLLRRIAEAQALIDADTDAFIKAATETR